MRKNLRTIFLFGAILLIVILIAASGVLQAGATYRLTSSQQLKQAVVSWFIPPVFEMEKSAAIAVQPEQLIWWNEAVKPSLDFSNDYFQTIFSETGNYFAVTTLTGRTGNPNQARTFAFTVYSANRAELYSLTFRHFYDQPFPTVVISDQDGAAVVGHSATGEIRFYDQSGNLVAEKQLFPSAEYDLERILDISLSADGSRVAVAATKRGSAPNGSSALHPSGEPHLFLFTPKGEEIRSIPLPGYQTSGCVISPNGAFVVANSYTVESGGSVVRQDQVFNAEGTIVARLDLLFKYAQFSPDNRSLLLANNSTAKMVDLTTGTIVWRHQISADQGMITAARVANEGKVSLLLVAKNEFRNRAFIFTHPRLMIFNQTGEILQQIELTDQVFHKPALGLTVDGQQISIGFNHSYQIFRVK